MATVRTEINPEEVVNVAAVAHRSPFRYPGGKTWLVPRIRRWLRSLNPRPRELAEPFVTLGWLPPESTAGLAQDPYPYGVRSNQKVLETIAQYSHEQGLTPRVMDLGEVFAPATMDL